MEKNSNDKVLRWLLENNHRLDPDHTWDKDNRTLTLNQKKMQILHCHSTVTNTCQTKCCICSTIWICF